MVKKTLYLLMVIVCCVLVLETNTALASLTNGLVAYYPFNPFNGDVDNNSVIDESGNNHN